MQFVVFFFETWHKKKLIQNKLATGESSPTEICVGFTDPQSNANLSMYASCVSDTVLRTTLYRGTKTCEITTHGESLSYGLFHFLCAFGAFFLILFGL